MCSKVDPACEEAESKHQNKVEKCYLYVFYDSGTVNFGLLKDYSGLINQVPQMKYLLITWVVLYLSCLILRS